MNPLCSVCENPATKVCKHKECQVSPFCCEGPCIRNASQKMHTHYGDLNFISYDQFQEKLSEIKKTLDPHVLHKEFLEDIKKKIELTKDSLKQKICNSLDHVYKQLENDLCVELKVVLNQKEEETMKKISEDSNSDLFTGQQLRYLLADTGKYKEQKETFEVIKCIKEKFEQQLQHFQEFKFESMFMSYFERKQKSQALFSEGQTLKNSKQHLKAIDKYKQVQKINSFSHKSSFKIGECLYELNQLDQSQEAFKSCLLFDPKDSNIYFYLGSIQFNKKNFQKAVDWYSKSIEIDKKRPDFFSNRGLSYFELKKYEEANSDYLSALKLKPNQGSYLSKIHQIGVQIGKKYNFWW